MALKMPRQTVREFVDSTIGLKALVELSAFHASLRPWLGRYADTGVHMYRPDRSHSRIYTIPTNVSGR